MPFVVEPIVLMLKNKMPENTQFLLFNRTINSLRIMQIKLNSEYHTPIQLIVRCTWKYIILYCIVKKTEEKYPL